MQALAPRLLLSPRSPCVTTHALCLARLVLVYPVVHGRLPPPSEELADAIRYAPADAEVFTAALFEEIALQAAGSRAALTSPAVFAANADLVGLPPVFILNVEHDLLRASGELFGEQLRRAGVTVSVDCEPGAVHGHLDRPGDEGAVRSLERIAGWLRGERRG